MKRLKDVNRMGFGAMQLAGPHVFGPPVDEAECRRVLERAIELGVNHIDTSDYYGPFVVNDLIRETLHPYAPELVLVTKVGARRDEKGDWLPDFEPDAIRRAVHDNLGRLGIDRIGGVNLRVMDGHEGSIAAQWTALAELQDQRLIGDIGLSNATFEQISEMQTIAPVACVQNSYNIADRGDDDLIDALSMQDIYYVPFFPLGGFTPLDTSQLEVIAKKYDATGRQIALAWLLERAPNILLIPGTSTVAHLEENLAAAHLTLSEEDFDALDDLHGPARESEEEFDYYAHEDSASDDADELASDDISED